jgi:hypothetical protein
MTKSRLTRLEIKHAIISDSRFRELFPELKEDVAKVLQNPSCGCNVPIYDKFFKYKDRLAQYFSEREIKAPHEEAAEASQNHWNVINCKVDELEDFLNKLHKVGRLQLAVARYEDQITVIVNDIGIVF